MSEDRLHRAKIGAVFDHVRRTRVPQHVWRRERPESADAAFTICQARWRERLRAPRAMNRAGEYPLCSEHSASILR